jgi:hypothetical protein
LIQKFLIYERVLGTEYEVIEVLERYAVIKVIDIDGEWLQVKVIESGNYGYVNVIYVYKI